MKTKLEEIKHLIKQLNQYSYEYYTLGEPTISDETYDSLYEKLSQLEEETQIILSNSPTQNVGNIVLNKLNKSTHEYPMLSLDKTKDIDKFAKFINGKDCVLMHKLDGITVSITYDNGTITKAETRGNGIEGEDITHNITSFQNVPLHIKDLNHIVVSGESIITYDDFNKINSKLPNDKQYKNPRNLVSGSVRQLDSKICKTRNVKFIAYNLFNTNLSTKEEQLKYMKELGFDIVDYRMIYSNDKIKLQLLIDELKQIAIDNNIPIDGRVITYNNIKYGESLGNTLHHPLHSFAFKETDDVEFTTLRDIKWQVGRTGVLTPVAIFDEVELCGTTVSKASLHNINILKDLKLGIGDNIGVIKANQIIPQVVDNLTKSNTYEIPTICPYCRKPTQIVESNNSKLLICTNDNCKSKLIQRISHYVSREGMNIEGLSEKTIEKFINLGILESIIDIYKLENHKSTIIHQDGFGVKSYNNLINSINKSKKCKLENFIYALGIPNVGKSTSMEMVKYCKNTFNCKKGNEIFSLIITRSVNDWLKMKDCGNIVANSIFKYFKNKDNLKTILELFKTSNLIFINNIDKEYSNTNGVFKDKLIYCTGTFAKAKKNDLKKLVEDNGGIFANGFSTKLDMLVVGSVKGSSKEQKAKDKGIKVVYEEEFFNMIIENK